MQNRQMRGEELQGLNIEQLQQLEKSLEVGLSRVIEKKVHEHFFFLLSLVLTTSICALNAAKISFFFWLTISGRENYE